MKTASALFTTVTTPVLSLLCPSGCSACDQLVQRLCCFAGYRCPAAEAAAAKEKARKKFLKIQGIASQADKAQSAVIVDAIVLESEEDTDVDEAGCSCTEKGNEAEVGSEAQANNSKRTRRRVNVPTAGPTQHNSSYSPPIGTKS